MADDYRFTGSKEGAALEASVSSVAEPAYRFEGRVQAPSLDVEDAPSGDIYVFDGEVRHDDLSVASSDVSSEVYGFNVEFVRKSLAVSGAEGCGDVYEFTLDFGCSGGPVDLSGYYRKSEVDDLLSKKASRASTLRGYGIKDVYIEGTTIHIGGESVSVGGEGGSPVLYPFEIVEYTSGKYAVKVADKFLFGDSLVSIDGFFSNGFLSVRGLDDTTGSGSGGTDLPAVWESLTKNELPYFDTKINTAHIPVLPQSKVDGLAESLSALKTLIGGKADSSQLADYVLKSTYDTGMSGKLDKSVFDKLFTVHYKEGSATEIESLELNYGTWTTGFLSARGLDDTTGSGSGGTDLPAVWESLTKNELPYQDVTINTAHIPVLPQSKVTGLPDALSSLRLGYTGISALIPQAATADNQLADKEFVNSSIATATATFRGTFATLEALKATPADRNDYAFWAHKDEAGNTCYDKYTYDGSVWKFEYRLNNSSFTAAQWGAINSGITDTLVTKLSGIATGAQVNVIETVKLGGTALAVSGKAVDITGTGIKSALGISDWALAASKPSYTTAEVTEKTNLYYTDARVKAYADTLYLGKSATAAAATKLANSRKLWGNAFNGMADVSGDITLGSGKRIYFGSTSYYIELVNGNIHTNVGLYSDKFISARSVDPDAGGGSGASLPVVWASLQGNTDDYKDKTIHQAHIPTLPVSRIDGLATALSGKQPLITSDNKLDYSLLKNTPAIGNGTVTIKQNGTSKGSFTMNQSGGATINLTDTTYSSLAAASGGTAVSLVTTGEKYTWNNKQAAISDLATIRSNAANGATAHGWGDHSKAGYITGITKAMVESVLTGNITSHTHTFDSLTSKPTTLGGYGIEDWVLEYSADSPDTFKTSGIYRVSTTGTTGNGYWFNYGNVLVLRGTNTSDTIAQLAASFANSNLYYRSGTVSNFTDADHPWRLIYNSGNCNKSDVDWNAANLTAEKRVRIKNANVIAFLSTDAMPKERLLGPMSSYNYDLAWHNGAQWNKVYHSGNFIDGTDYISPKTTLVGYGITDASRIFRYTIPASGNKGVRITFTANEPVKITVSGSNQHAQLVIVGTGYGGGGFIRNNFTELVHSDSGYSWCMPDEACSVEVFSTRIVSDYVTVESPSPVTFTAISALSTNAVNRRLLTAANYSSYALPLTGGTLSGWLLINASTLPISELTADTSTLDTSWNRAQNINLLLRSENNAMTISLGGQSNERKGIIQVGHAATTYANVLGDLYLNKFGGKVYIGEKLAYHEGNCNNVTTDWVCNGLRAAAEVNTQRIEFASIGSSAGHGGFIDFHFNGSTEDYTSRIIEDAKGRLSLRTPIVRVGTTSSATLTLARPSFNYIWTDVAGGTLVLGTTDGGVTSSSNSAIFIKGKKVYIGGTETGDNALNVLGVAHATTGIYTDGYISARKQDTSSDMRLKTDFRPIAGALEYIRGTHFTRFRWKDGSGESVGIIAQEEQSREYGFLVRSHGEIGHLTYDYAASTALLGAALQEEDNKVEALKRRVKKLENELDRLKQSNYAN